MHRLPMAAVVLALLAAACGSDDDQPSSNTSSTTIAAQADEATTTSSAESAPAPTNPTDGLVAVVTEVPDGDSFTVVVDGQRERVRLIGINAPESDECFGPEAGDLARGWLLDRQVTLTPADPERDDFDRLLVYVWLDGTQVNGQLIADGLAVARDQSGHSLADLYEEIEAAARDAKVGLWSPTACGEASPTNLRITDLQHNAPGPDEENPNGEWIEILNDGTDDADLTDWGIRDESTRHRFTFPAGTHLPAGQTAIVFSGCGNDTATEFFWCGEDPIWNNGGDTAFLIDPNGNIVDTWAYTG